MNETRKYRIIGVVLYYILKILSFTLKIKIINKENIDFDAKNYIIAFWHNKLLLPSITAGGFMKKRAVLASPSKDGELISVPLQKLGFEMIRGSSGQNSTSGLLSLMKYLKKGYNVGTPLDGPKGPLYIPKPGLLYLAQKTNTPVLPVGGGYKSKWIFSKTWDKFQVPKPFTTLVFILGKPIIIPKDDNIENYSDIIGKAITELDEKAHEYY
jgi:lysophospholipid acyltransferase (LPLAT)-like uncharacterized protein